MRFAFWGIVALVAWILGFPFVAFMALAWLLVGDMGDVSLAPRRKGPRAASR